VLQPVCVAGRGATFRAAELNHRFGGNIAYPPPPRQRCDAELNRIFRKNTQGGREGVAHRILADAPVDFNDPGDGEADFGTDFDQPCGIAQNPRQHVAVGLQIAQISASLFAKGNDRAAVIDDDRLQGADQSFHGSWSSSTRARQYKRDCARLDK